MSCNTIFNRVFTRNVINDLLKNNSNDIYNSVIRRLINNPENKNNGEIISEIYSYIGKENRNEYFYMNTLINKLLVCNHNVNTTTALSQLWIGKSKADFVMINGVGKVYEIKSELDNFERLDSQLHDYYKAFSLVIVVAAESQFNKLERLLSKFGDIGKSIGIYTLTERDTISKSFRREPIIFNDYLQHSCIFKLLRKTEYENILNLYFGELPKATQFRQYKACLELFYDIPILKAQELAFQELKKRNKIKKIDFESIPNELKSVIYFSGLLKNIKSIENMLSAEYRG